MNRKRMLTTEVTEHTKTNRFRHGSIPVGVMAIKMLGEKTDAFTSIFQSAKIKFV